MFMFVVLLQSWMDDRSETPPRKCINALEQTIIRDSRPSVCATKGICRRPPPVPVKVKVDRPFLFVVYDKPQNIVQFVAKVETVSPVAAAAEASALPSTPTLPSALGDKRERGD